MEFSKIMFKKSRSKKILLRCIFTGRIQFRVFAFIKNSSPFRLYVLFFMISFFFFQLIYSARFFQFLVLINHQCTGHLPLMYFKEYRNWRLLARWKFRIPSWPRTCFILANFFFLYLFLSSVHKAQQLIANVREKTVMREILRKREIELDEYRP